MNKLTQHTRYLLMAIFICVIQNTGSASFLFGHAGSTTSLFAPLPPSGLTLSGMTTSSIDLSWNDNSLDELGFTIERATSFFGPYTVVVITGPDITSYTDIGLLDNTRYYYRLSSFDGSGSSGYIHANAWTLLAAPLAPSDLVLSGETTSTIDLEWTDNSHNESGFYIERRTTATSFVQIHTAAANATSYTDTNLDDDTEYFYRVRATNATGESSYSNEPSTSTLLAIPKEPTALILSGETINSIDLTWTDNSDNETDFLIERRTALTLFVQVSSVSADITVYTDTGLDDDTEYFYRVRATNAAGESGYTNVESTSTLVTLPLAPTGLALSGESINSIDLDWIDNSDNETNFLIERRTSLTVFAQIQSVGADVNYYTDINLDDDTEYFYRVRATNSAGESGYTNTESTSTLLAPPDAPTALILSGETTSSIDLVWADNSDSETGFLIERRTALTIFAQVATTLADVNTYTDINLDDDTQYFYRVRATNLAGESDYTNIAQTTTLLAVPDAPTNLLLGGITTNSIDLTWVDNSDNETWFQIERSLTFVGGYSLIYSAAADMTSYTSMGLEDNTQYFFRVRAINAAGPSGYTAVASATTQLAVPAAPSSLVLSNITHNSMDLNWLDNSDNETGFEIERSLTSGFGFTLIHTTAAGITSYTNTGLLEETEYFYRVRAINAAGGSFYTSEASATTLLQAPADPSNLVLSNVTTSTIDLAWTDNSTNEAGFEIERSLNILFGYTLIHTTLADVTTYTDMNLDDTTQYFYRVRAFNLTGPSGYTPVASATTFLDIPVAPSALEAAATSICDVDLKWIDNADNEDGFEIERSLSPIFGYSLIHTTLPDITSFSDTGAVNNTTYYYRIRAFNTAGKTTYTPYAGVTVNIVLNGGVIGTNQSVCPNGDPDVLTNFIAPSGGGGIWSYQWQSRILPGIYTNIPGAIGLSYDPMPPFNQTADFQRMATTACGIVVSNSVTVTVEDLESPVFTYCPNDTLIKIERNELTALVTPNIPDTLDNCGIVLQTWSLTGATSATSPATGINELGLYTFNLGITTVTYHVEDLTGNAAECVFNVTVEIKDPEVLNVTIPNASMKIGDVISATITVGDDGGQAYSMISGTIGGYPLTNFQRINSTTYLANFMIFEGGNSYAANQPIPVANLILTDGVVPSIPYILPIIQNNDLLDAEIPVVFSMVAVPGAYKIGDVLNINIAANGLNYSIHPNSIINGIYLFFELPNVIFTELGGGNYRLSYIIQEGNLDVAPGELNVTVILVKPSGNSSIEYTTVVNTGAVSIDAHPPVVTRMEAPPVEVGVGGTVQITVTADGEDYTAASGTTINGVPLSSSRVTFSELTGGLYELSYVVGGGDGNVAPGSLEMSMVMSDPNGNTSEPFPTLLPNSLEIYTELPTASLAGTPQICEEEEAVLSVFLNGRSPWSFDLSDGSTITSFTDVSLSEYQIIVTPDRTTTYRITSVIDRNGVENTGTSDFEVNVNQKTEVEIINLATGYSVEADEVILEANIAGGTFSGPGVVSATGIFYPALADTVNSPHTILYTYENANGCISVDSALVFVLGAEGDVFIPSGLVCDDGDPFKVTGSNVAGVNGSFSLQNESGQGVSGLTDHGDNSATIDPTQLNEGAHTIVYQYVDGVTLYIRVSFLVESVPEPVITSLDQTTFCQSDLPVSLQADDTTAIFSGPGVFGNEVDGFFFDPAQANLGGNTIICTVTTLNGCSKSSEKDVLILFAPEMDFTISTACIPLDGGIVSFNNLTSGKILVESWAWEFGDPGSGENNQSDLVDPTHFYSGPGVRSISLTATTFEGCVNSLVLDTTIGYQPVADFTWISDCYANGAGVKFLNRSTSGSSTIDSLMWTFRSSTGAVLGSLGTNSTTDTVAYPFSSVDSYLIDLIILNEHKCSDSITKELVLRPTFQVENDNYQEDFDSSEGMWTIESNDQVESWVWDVPDFTGFEQVPGDKAWFTQLPSGVIDYRENSWMQSPCFDFTGVDRPLIKMDIMRSFVPDQNGAVLQYMDVIEEGWKTVGGVAEGIDWYNMTNIQNRPGGSSIGWGLEVFYPDTEWISAVHDLDQVAGNPHVAFRIAIASTGAQGIGNQGFAVDNVSVARRSKLTILEHFTNSADQASRTADDIIDALSTEYSGDVIDIQYHMDVPGIDPMNLNNPIPASTRSGQNGIQGPPYAILDGGILSHHRYDFNELKTTPDADHIKLLSLEIPLFDIDLSVDWIEGGLVSNTTVTCRADQFNEPVHLYMAVIETSVTAYIGGNGDTHFRNVVLDMMPTPAGKLLGSSWYKGKSDIRTNTWTFLPYVGDANKLAVVAFIQDRTSGRMLQAAVDYADKSVGVGDRIREVPTVQVYPNPVVRSFYVNLGTPSEYDCRYELMDISGKILLNGNVPAGYQIYQVEIGHLTRGIYIINWYEGDRLRGLNKIVKTD